jgi:hypothetical protein
VIGTTTTVPKGGTAEARATCPAGTVLVSGGWNAGFDGAELEVTKSFRDIDGVSWDVAARSTTTSFDQSIFALAYCE